MGTGNKLDFVGDTSQPVILDDLDSLTIPIDSGQAFDSPHRNDVAEMILNQTGPLTGTKAAIASSTRLSGAAKKLRRRKITPCSAAEISIQGARFS